MSDIKPIDLPSSAGSDFGNGDVRHFSEDDAVEVPSLQNPTRQLAQRDNLLAAKLNEVVQTVNNKEQLVPIPVLRTNVGAATEETIANFRIPPGFEARVLNAIVGTTPASANVSLSIFYATGYGNTSGQNIVTTTDEFTSGGKFYNNGEFIVVLKNIGSISLECVASITLTVRPMGSQASLLVGSVVTGQQGNPGQQGGKGDKGDPGVGGTGSPGMLFKLGWLNGATYSAPTDVVSHQDYGTLTSSYIATQTHVALTGVNEPPNPAFWAPVAIGSSGSSTTNINTVITSSGSIPNYYAHVVQAQLITGAEWVGAVAVGYAGYSYDGSAYAAGTTAYFNCSESYVESVANNPGFNRGLTFLNSVLRVAFTGNGTLVLPKIVRGAKVDYANTNVGAVVAVHGAPAALKTTKTVAISSLTRSTTTATATSVAHGFSTGDVVTVSGVSPSQYNGTFIITVTSADTFTYTMVSDPGSSGSGTMVASDSTFAVVPLVTVIPTSTDRFVLKCLNGSPVSVEIAISGVQSY